MSVNVIVSSHIDYRISSSEQGGDEYLSTLTKETGILLSALKKYEKMSRISHLTAGVIVDE